MTDGPDLLGRILAEPDEDLHRLQYADWLEENAGTLACGACGGRGRTGEHWDPASDTLRGGRRCPACHGECRVPDALAARAEFIRVGCELARLSASQTCRECCPVSSRIAKGCHGCDLRRRERELLAAHGRGWGPPGFDWHVLADMTLGATMAPHPTAVAEFRRGFVEAVTLSGADWLAHERALVWRPGLFDPCPACEDESPYRIYCDRCEESGRAGRVPRPMPPTACPIREVTLTTLGDDPDSFCVDNQFSVTVKGGRSLWTSPRWPGITFDLSSAAQAPHAPAASPGT